jgi:hypothetical protein
LGVIPADLPSTQTTTACVTAENRRRLLFSIVTEGIFLLSFQEHLWEEGLVCSAVINYQVQS